MTINFKIVNFDTCPHTTDTRGYMSPNEHKIHIFHQFCTLNNSNYLYYVVFKKNTQQYQNQASIRPKKDLPGTLRTYLVHASN